MKKILFAFFFLTATWAAHAQPQHAWFVKNGGMITNAISGANLGYSLNIKGTNCQDWKPAASPYYSVSMVSEKSDSAQYAIIFTNTKANICEVKMVYKNSKKQSKISSKILYLGNCEYPCIQLNL